MSVQHVLSLIIHWSPTIQMRGLKPQRVYISLSISQNKITISQLHNKQYFREVGIGRSATYLAMLMVGPFSHNVWIAALIYTDMEWANALASVGARPSALSVINCSWLLNNQSFTKHIRVKIQLERSRERQRELDSKRLTQRYRERERQRQTRDRLKQSQREP